MDEAWLSPDVLAASGSEEHVKPGSTDRDWYTNFGIREGRHVFGSWNHPELSVPRPSEWTNCGEPSTVYEPWKKVHPLNRQGPEQP
jgi:hypothetical protein